MITEPQNATRFVGNLIDGEERAASSASAFERSDRSDLEAAVAAASAAQPAWARRTVAQSLQMPGKQGVSEVHWVKIRDDAPNTGFQTSRQSGLYFHAGTPKPALQSFHSP